MSESPLAYPKSSANKRSVLAVDSVPAIYMVRHGDTALNSGHTSPEKFRSHIDVPLSPEGKKEGQEIAKKLCAIGEIDCVYSSDLQRASDTGQMIADACKVDLETDERLRPWDLGTMAGTPVKEGIAKLKQYVSTPNTPLPGGESFNQFKEEYLDVLDEILEEAVQKKESYVIVTHTRDLQLTKASYDVPGGLSNHNIDISVFEDYSKETSTGNFLTLKYDGKAWKMQGEKVESK